MLLCRCKQRLKLRLADFLFLNQQGGAGMKNVVILFDDVLCLLITLVNDSLDLAVNGVSHLIAVGLGMGQIPSDEYLVLITAVLNHSHLLRHAVLGHHGPGNLGGLLDILGSAGGDIVKYQLFRNPAA